MIPELFSNKNLNPLITELFIRGRKSYFAVPKAIRLNSTHYFIMKSPNKQAFQQIAFNHSTDIVLETL